ncbi:MAG: CHASE3 domain-containing protein [Verrucomicrobia bacterium]|nr:CHASE3 domain-containing protein [Verrucomicrobiota bacterium]
MQSSEAIAADLAGSRVRDRLVTVGFTLALVLLVTVGWLALRAFDRQSADAAWARHTMEVLLEIEALNSNWQEALTAQRYYLITGEDFHRAAFEQSAAAARQRLARARSLTADNTDQQKRLGRVAALFEERLPRARARMDLRAREGLEAVRRDIATRGEISGELDRLIETLSEAEHVLLTGREAATAQSVQHSRTAMIAGIVLSVALVTVALLLLRRDARARRRAGEALLEANERLEARVAERTAELHASEQHVRALNADLEQRVAERTTELRARTRELEAFSYSVSHDLKAPLRGIDGYSRLLLEDHAAALDQEGRDFLGYIRNACAQMGQLIEDLLAYSRLERRTMSRSTVELRSFVDSILSTMSADLARVRLENEVAETRVQADPEGLAIAVRNLVDNAVKFSAAAPEPHICLRTEPADGACALSVADNGTGFDMRFVEKVFEIFQRLHRAEEYPGTGVGLALVRKAMERMGGSVTAESAPGRGATFTLRLPLAAAPTP